MRRWVVWCPVIMEVVMWRWEQSILETERRGLKTSDTRRSHVRHVETALVLRPSRGSTL